MIMRRLVYVLVMLFFLSCFNSYNRMDMLKNIFSDFDIEHIGEGATRMEYVGIPEVIDFPEIVVEDLEPVPFDSIYESVRIVPLETNEHSFFGGVSVMNIINDTAYILDSRGIKGLLRFTINGKFIDKIGSVGQGPGEYVSPQNFFVFRDRICIIDNSQQKILCYSRDGKFVEERRIPFYADQAVFMDDSMFVFRCPLDVNPHIPAIDQSCMWITDSNFNVLKSGLRTPLPSNCSVYDDNAMKIVGGEIVCFENIIDSLFVINKDCDLECKYVLKFGRHRDKSFYSDKKTFRESFSNPDFYNIAYCNMSRDFVDCSLTIGGKPCMVLYSRNSRKTLVYDEVVFDNGCWAPMMNLDYTLYKDYYVEARPIEAVPQDSLTMSTWQKHIKGDFTDVKPDDNPVLVFYKLRKW